MLSFHVAFIFTFTLVYFLPSALADRKLTVNNACADTLWPAVVSTAIGSSTFKNAGWQANPNTSFSLTLPDSWQGSIWARQACDASGSNCAVGDCGGINCTANSGSGPHTLAEFSLALSTDSEDFYDISLIEGANVPIEIKTNTACPSIDCSANFTVNCPASLRGPVVNGQVLACEGPCLSQTPGSSDCANQDVYNWMHQYCPKTYVSPTDDDNGLQSNITCPGGQTADYTVTMCPIGSVVAGVVGAAPLPSNTASSSSSVSSPSGSSSSPSPSANAPTKSPSPKPDSATTGQHSKLSGGAIGGIVVAVVVSMSGLAAFLVWLLRRRRRHDTPETNHFTEKDNIQPLAGGSYIIEPFTGSDRHVSPFPGASDPALQSSSNRYNTITAASGKRELLAREEQQMRERDAARSADVPTAAPSYPRSESLGPPPLDELGPGDGQDVDLDRLFEERDPVFEDRLRRFLQERMDRPGEDGQRLQPEQHRVVESASDVGTDLPRYPGA